MFKSFELQGPFAANSGSKTQNVTQQRRPYADAWVHDLPVLDEIGVSVQSEGGNRRPGRIEYPTGYQTSLAGGGLAARLNRRTCVAWTTSLFPTMQKLHQASHGWDRVRL